MISRRHLLGAFALTPFSASLTAATPTMRPRPRCGINYDAGTRMMPGPLTRPDAHQRFASAELTSIRDDLHCTSVRIFGSEPDRLLACAEMALDLGLEVTVQTRINDTPPAQTVDIISAVGAELEKLRIDAPSVRFDVGCEFSLFAGGLIPGESFVDRMSFLESDKMASFPLGVRHRNYLERITAAARSTFHGNIQYSTFPDEPVDWSLVDIIGLDHYWDRFTKRTYADIVSAKMALGKPVAISEFGCCAYTGAAELGGMAWNEVDMFSDTPSIPEHFQRDEREQAETIHTCLEHLTPLGLDSVSVYGFIEPDMMRSSDPRHDFDILSYALVACMGDDHPKPYETTGHWVAKQAFDTVAAWNTDASTPS